MPNKKKTYPPDMRLRKVEAVAYLNCGGTTFDNYVKAGKIQHVSVSASDPRVRFYCVQDLDRMKTQLGHRAGKRLHRQVAVPSELLAHADPDFPGSSSTGRDETPIAELDTIEARLMETVGVPSTVSLHQGQTLLRKHILMKAVQNKVVDTLFDGLNNPDARVQQTAVKSILALILPQLKTVESIKVDSPEDVERQTKLSADITALHDRIKQLRIAPPTIVMEGMRIIEVE
jgi:hypothetical protein